MQLSQFKKIGKKNRKKMVAFINELDSSNLDGIHSVVRETEEQVWNKTQCLDCGNCCRTMTPILDLPDMQRIATYLNIDIPKLKRKYLEYYKTEKEWRMKALPCVFLNIDTNKCTIYDARPEDCRSFPHLAKFPLEDYMYIHKQNIKYCPATYLFIKKLMQQITFK